MFDNPCSIVHLHPTNINEVKRQDAAPVLYRIFLGGGAPAEHYDVVCNHFMTGDCARGAGCR
jgi:hypothetical protein